MFDTAVGKVGVYICYDRHFPEGWRALGLNGAEIVFNPSATSRGLSEYIWRVEQPAAAVANMYYVGAINRVGIEADIGDDDFYGQSYFVDPEGKFVGDVGDAYKPELIVRDLDMDKIKLVRDRWAFYRDRRPDAYDELVEAVTPWHDAHQDGTVVSATGRTRRRRARSTARRSPPCSPPGRPTRSGSPSAGTRDRRHRQVRHPRRHRRAHAHGAALRRHRGVRHVRDRHDRRGVGRRHDDRRLRRAAHRRERAGRPRRRGTRKADGNCAIDYGFHQIIGGVDEESLKAMTLPRRQRGHHQLQAVHGLPRRVLLRRRPDPAGDADGRRVAGR